MLILINYLNRKDGGGVQSTACRLELNKPSSQETMLTE